jgi:hypothetical protein
VLPVAQPLLAVHNKAAGRRLQEMYKLHAPPFRACLECSEGAAHAGLKPGATPQQCPGISSTLHW